MEPDDQERLTAAVELLEKLGPSLGRPLVDTLKGSKHPNMKELRPGTVRVLFAFDPRRTAILLLAGDKSGHWKDWYVEAIPEADRLFDDHLESLIDEEG
ncbi:MAG: type II toxin-antitoxin system RelE/ParE family toxin [Actinomycetes bacterium]